MSPSLIPEKPLVISPSLAATIGLEEAVLLHTLHEAITHRQTENKNHYHWLTLSQQTLLELMPFWNCGDLQRIVNSLRDKGIILIESAPLAESGALLFAINEQQSGPTDITAPSTGKPRQAAPGKTLMPPSWRPDPELLKQLAMQNVPQDFAMAQVDEFVLYWQDRFESAYSWNSKFRSQVIRKWRDRDQRLPFKAEESAPVTREWQPSLDALEILQRSGISQNFIEDAIPEFVLYWQERGETGKTWNSKFILHVKRQWARYTSTLSHDTEPRRIATNWQPDNDVYDILRLANIDLEFARQLLPEFVIYWRDSNELHRSWNSKFLQHAKFHWAKQHQMRTQQSHNDARRQGSHQQGSTRARSLADDLSDRSWAD
jgi:hypothetical protein